ncbi:imm11 family protein [Pseudomonas asiatica]|uniref:imm11 family protein n=1 Tax=Pseudomonas asiatica TaxID=2219225 RepID=UPI0038FBE947
MNAAKYYALRYCSREIGCPIVLSGFFNCDEFEWDSFDSNPMELEVRNSYSLELSGLEMPLHDLDFDYYQVGEIYVSKRFLRICDELGAKYKAIPLEISYQGDSRKDEFFIFLPGKSLAALDKVNSVFEVSKDMEAGLEIESPIYPGTVSIDSITRFVVSSELEEDIFRCQETLEIFCSERFKSAASGLKGIAFEGVDEDYVYDAWADLNDI